MVDKCYKTKRKNLLNLNLNVCDDYKEQAGNSSDNSDGCDHAFKQNFDLVTPETDEPQPKQLWGLPMPEFVPETFVSWVEHLQEEPHYELHGKDVIKKVNEKLLRVKSFYW